MRCYHLYEELEHHDGAQASGDELGDVDRRADPCRQGTGAFDNLPGAGKPLPNLDQEYDPVWWVKQLVQREQISILPPSLELLRKVEKELAAIEKLHDEVTVRRRVAALNVEIAKVNATVMEGPPTRLSTLDVDKVVERWRRTAPPILASSPVSPPPRSGVARSSDSRRAWRANFANTSRARSATSMHV